MDNNLRKAYQATDYCLWLAGREIVLNVGKPAPEALNILQTRLQLTGEAFVVAPCNPGSELLSAEANRELLAQFRNRLRQDNQRWLPAVNRDPQAQWPEEHGALLLDCGLSYAQTLGLEYGQNAILGLGRDAIPKLIDLVSVK